MDIVALTRLRRLDSLVIDLGLRNSIVQQAGQFWRPFIIWSLKEALGLQELDRIEVSKNDNISLFQLLVIRLYRKCCANIFTLTDAISDRTDMIVTFGL